MKQIAVITGGGSGMGLETAKAMPKEKAIVISGRTLKKLEAAVEGLKEVGFEAYPFACDTSSRESVQALAEYAAGLGTVKNVVNAAGVSPHMAQAEQIIKINALGTVYVNQEFAKVMEPGSVIVDIASNSGYMLPGALVSTRIYALADTNEAAFLKKMLQRSGVAGKKMRAGMAYTYSKNFAIWYAKKCAFDFAPQGIRVCSVSPGLIRTPMGAVEKDDGGFLIGLAAEKRMGRPEELAFLIAAAADERNGYLAGVDVLADGGATTHMKQFKKYAT